jgi:predicted type IV restriction endonuclease
MDFKDTIRQLSERVAKLKDNIHTEEATKTALILPFLQALGYDVFNPLEVVPEYVSDIGTKKGEKVDYAILQENGDPCILIECKHWAQNLTLHDNQLLRYFHVTKARFGILTNGIIYRFYTDLMEANKMDEKPFLEINTLDLKEPLIEELKKFHKSYFNVEQIINTASDLKYSAELRQLIHSEFSNPSDVLVRHLAKQVYTGVLHARMMEYFTGLLRKSFNHYVSDQITDRLKNALGQEAEVPAVATPLVVETPNPNSTTTKDSNLIVTTAEELEGFYIVRSMLRPHVESHRIVHRDAQTYFAILLDDNNRKPICRLHFNSSKKYLGLLGADKKEVRFEIQSLDDLYQYQDQLIESLKNYEKSSN